MSLSVSQIKALQQEAGIARAQEADLWIIIFIFDCNYYIADPLIIGDNFDSS